MDELEELAAEFVRMFKPEMDINNTKVVTVQNQSMSSGSVTVETALVQNHIDKLGKKEDEGSI